MLKMMPNQSTSTPSYDRQILQSLRRIIHAVDIYSRKLRSQCDLTAPQLMCLLHIAQEGPLTSVQLSRLVHLSPSTLVGILDRLEAKGLIRRDRNQRDRRVVSVSVTPSGEELAASAPSPLQDKLAKGLSQLPKTTQESIAQALHQIVEMMEAPEIEGTPPFEMGGGIGEPAKNGTT